MRFPYVLVQESDGVSILRGNNSTRHWSKFFCEAECDARFGPDALDGVSPGGLMGTMQDLLGSTTSLALSSLEEAPAKRHGVQRSGTYPARSWLGKGDSGSEWVRRLPGFHNLHILVQS